MKDYRLSEIRDECEEKCNSCSLKEIPCKSCKMQEICKTLNWQKYHRGFSPNNWELDPRDMIELPCKVKIKSLENGETTIWQIVYRAYQYVCYKMFQDEAEADAFLAELKGDRK